MSEGWGYEGEPETVEDSDDSEEATGLQRAVDDASVQAIDIDELRGILVEVEDVELIQQALTQENRPAAWELYRKRLDALGVEIDSESESDAESNSYDEPDATTVSEPEAESTQSEGIEIAPPGGAMTIEQAAEREQRWSVMVWGEPHSGKTHFAFTMPEPIAVIDTEGKAHDIADKFTGKTAAIWQPENYQEASEALDYALNWLSQYEEKTGDVGTLVVDSMSIMWEWSKQEYVRRYYPMEDSPSDVNFKSAMQAKGGQSDWKKIKEIHNERFRKRMVQSPYHICWTAMATDDFAEKLEHDMDYAPEKPAGEKDNVFKVNHIIRLTGERIGHLEKTGLTKYRAVGIEEPSYPRLTHLVDELRAFEDGETDSLPYSAEPILGATPRGGSDDDE